MIRAELQRSNLNSKGKNAVVTSGLRNRVNDEWNTVQGTAVASRAQNIQIYHKLSDEQLSVQRLQILKKDTAKSRQSMGRGEAYTSLNSHK